MKKQIYYLTALVLCAALYSCGSEEIPAGEPDDGIQYVLTRAVPPNGTTYTFLSCLDGQQIISSENYRGYYAYVGTAGDGFYGGKNLLIPFNSNAANYTYTSRNNDYAQRLSAGIYQTAIITPAIPVGNVAGLGYLARFYRADIENVYASDPYNKTATDVVVDKTPLAFHVQYNLQVYNIDLEAVKMTPIYSKLNVCFYSSVGRSFAIDESSTVDAGSSGWYNASTGITYPSYNYVNPALFNLPSVENTDGTHPSTVALPSAYIKIDESPDDLGKVPASLGTHDIKIQVDQFPLYSADYRESNSTYTKPVALRLKMTIGTGIARMDIPFKLRFERGKAYTFYVNVLSTYLSIDYAVSDWESGSTGSDNIGSILHYTTIPIGSYTPGDWETGSGDTDNIGTKP
jgi:hypothetical protein